MYYIFQFLGATVVKDLLPILGTIIINDLSICGINLWNYFLNIFFPFLRFDELMKVRYSGQYMLELASVGFLSNDAIFAENDAD